MPIHETHASYVELLSDFRQLRMGCIPKMAEKFRPIRLALKARTTEALVLDIFYYQP